MSLSQSDLLEIRNIVRDELGSQVEPLKSEIQALRNDIKEIYDMLARMTADKPDDNFDKLDIEQQLLKLNARLLSAAKQAGITLPR